MDIVPVIEIKSGRSVRSIQAKEDVQSLRSDDPLKIAKYFKDQGATRLYVRDLDGERVGAPQNRDVVRDIVRRTGIAVTFAGGVRAAAAVERALAWGTDRVVAETQVTLDPEIVGVLERFGDKVALEIRDVQGKMKKPVIEVEQWVEVDRFLGRIRVEQPWARFLFVPSKPSGEPAAVSVGQVTHFYGRAGKPVDVFGHIADCEQIEELVETGIESVFICEPFYDGVLTLSDALASARGAHTSYGGWRPPGGADGLLAPSSYQKPTTPSYNAPEPPRARPATPSSSLPLPPPPRRPVPPPTTGPATPQPPPKASPWPWKRQK